MRMMIITSELPSPYDENKKGKEMSFLFPFCFHGAVLSP